MWLESAFLQLVNYISKGGIVMYPLILLSVLMWSMVVERIIFFRMMYFDDVPKSDIISMIKNNSIIDFNKHGVNATLIKEILDRTPNDTIDAHVVDEAVVHVVNILNCRLKIIFLLASLAPLLGLLGTTIGMIKSFFVISIFGTGNVRALASGISEALITTQTGLFIAIPGIYISNFLNQRSRRLQEKVAKTGMYIIRNLVQ